jgi:hypothetical protein
MMKKAVSTAQPPEGLVAGLGVPTDPEPEPEPVPAPSSLHADNPRARAAARAATVVRVERVMAGVSFRVRLTEG